MILEDLLAHPENYDTRAARLGRCTVQTPVQTANFVGEEERVAVTADLDVLRRFQAEGREIPSFEKAGPHQKIFHAPAWTRAAIVTCGGLCPGLNDVIKGVVNLLWFEYGVRHVFGIRYGLAGFIPSFGFEPLVLNPDVVDEIHEDGGTILGSSRGSQDSDAIVETLARMNINILFCVGGDGTLRAAHDIALAARKRKYNLSVVGIPKTIDNDLNFIGRSFGFETAVYQTNDIIRSAHIEAKGAANGIGLVKLMGRDSGFIAAYAALANSVVNLCLIPEVPFGMEGPDGLLAALERRFSLGKTHAVIVVAEGAGQDLVEQEAERRDASGNVLKKDIGDYLRRNIVTGMRKLGRDVTVKYFDPSYSIRSVPAQGTDAILCSMLAAGAVHAAMAGRTDCVVGNLNDTLSLVPIPLATAERQKVDLKSPLWTAVIDATRQDEYFGVVPLRR